MFLAGLLVGLICGLISGYIVTRRLIRLKREALKQFQQVANDYIRKLMSEDGVGRRIMPPVALTGDQRSQLDGKDNSVRL